MKRSFCTLFDKNYLLFAIALNDSLRNFYSDGEYELFALAMDSDAYNALNKLSLLNVIPLLVDDVLSKHRDEISNMTFGQMCWTSQPLLCLYVLDNYAVQSVTYLEADSYFFDTPELIFEEIGNKSVSLVPHNYALRYDQTATSGIYCVQFNLFRNNLVSRSFLNDWFLECLKYNSSLPAYLPGQLCLDAWPHKSDEVVVIKNIGAGVAPWNSCKYNFSTHNGTLYVDQQPIIFFHFHQLSFVRKYVFLTSYPIPMKAKRLVYRKYIDALSLAQSKIDSKIKGYKFKKYYSFGIDYKRISSYKQIIKNLILFVIGNFVRIH